MKGIIRKVDKSGRIVIPADFREAYGIDLDSEVKLVPTQGCFYVEKHSKNVKCDITGKETDDIKVYGKNLFLSEEGKTKLLEVLQNELHR